ncbi:hypothetical protein GCM10017691_23820 [Pseudonocardia petroleophila]|uniref:Transglycosylase SLT domain-containing protein n=1 Tax=Pseudonocardia petroleophila TaxID=37331 RepID=A0A7G7MFW1_9PSEU|nr:hypothetical protein [Pseudonocardia petroleophila]QNG51672.1 hypothetical protein H6H00_26790 [Pseudonocardia petroleophila]
MAFTIATGVLKVTADTTKAVSALAALGGAAGLAGGALAALPALGAAAGGIGGVLAGSFRGVGEALKGYTADQKAATSASTKSAAQEAANARQIRDAKRAISDANKNAAQVAQESTAKINAAVQDQVSTARRGAEAISRAQENQAEVARNGADAIASASARVEDALRSEARAQENLTDAREDAARALDDLREKVDDFGLSQEGAAIRVIEAEQELAAVNADATATALDRRKAAYDLAVAQERVSDLTREQAEAQGELTEAEAKGVDGADNVRSAQEKLADAHRGTESAQANLAKTQREAAQANVDAAKKVSEAQRSAAEANAEAAAKVAETRQAAAQAESEAAQGVADALQNLADVQASQAESMAAATGAASAYATAMADLSPPARALVEQLNSMRPLVRELSDTSAAAFLPGLTQMLKDSEGLFPIFNGFLQQSGEIMGQTARDFGALFKSDEFKANMQATLTNSLPLIQAFGDGLLLLTDRWNALGAASGPAIAGLSSGLDSVFAGLGGLFDNLTPGMDAFGVILDTTLGAVGSLLPMLGTLISVLANALAPAFAILMPLITEIIGGLVTGLTPILQALGPIVTILANVIATVLRAALVALQPIFVALADVLVELTPVIRQMATQFGDLLVAALNAVAPLLPIIVSALGDILAAVIPVATVFLKFATQLIEELAPFLPQLLNLFVQLINKALLPLLPPLMRLIEIALPPLIDLLTFLMPIIVAVGQHLVDDIAWVVNTIIIPVLNKLGDGLRSLVDGFNRTRNDINAAWSFVGDRIRAVRESVIDPALNAVKAAAQFVADKFVVVRDAISAAWMFAGDRIRQVVDSIVGPIFGGLRSATDAVGRAFESVSQWIARSWASIQEAARRPVQWVVDVVYNNGIRRVWNGIAQTFGMAQLGEVRFAGGGVLPGYSPGRDTIPAMLSPGEGVLTPEAVRMVGAGNVLALNKAASGRRAGSTPSGATGRQHFADGGIAGFFGNLLSGPVDAVKSLFAGVTGDADKTPGQGMWRDALVKLPGKVIDAVIAKAKTFVTDMLSFGGGGDGGSGVQRWAGVTSQALGIMGQNPGLVPTVLRRMNQESGGNPTVVNRWDSNWIKGTPSVGLMQVIGPTYRANRHPSFDTGPYSYGTSVNPLSNILASMRYALGRYGSLPSAYNRPGGYDAGGWLPTGQSSVFNGTRRPEAVLTNEQWSTARAAIQSQAARPTDRELHVHVTQVSGSPAETGRFVALALRSVG